MWECIHTHKHVQQHTRLYYLGLSFDKHWTNTQVNFNAERICNKKTRKISRYVNFMRILSYLAFESISCHI